MTKRVLYIAYFYPPLGGAGVQRPLKTIKYLKEYGWNIDVLTVTNIQFHSYDHSLLSESQADTIYRVQSFDVMSILQFFKNLCRQFKFGRKKEKIITKKNLRGVYFNTPESIKKIIRGSFPIDSKIGWYPFAYHKARQLFQDKPYDLIFATMSPYTSGVLAMHLSQKTNCPFFIDYRDHWTLLKYPYYNFRFLHRHAERKEKKMLQLAAGVFTTSKLMISDLKVKFGDFIQDKSDFVYNGFDEIDFCPTPLSMKSPHIIIRYVGAFYGDRTVEHFINCLEILHQKNLLPANLHIEFIGNYYLEDMKLLTRTWLSSLITIIPQVPHSKAIEYIQTADLLLLFNPTNFGNEVIAGKLFEYIYANRPILAMIPPQGEAAQILQKIGYEYICQMEDENKIMEYLIHFFQNKHVYNYHGSQIEFVDSLSRKNQTQKIYQMITKKLG